MTTAHHRVSDDELAQKDYFSSLAVYIAKEEFDAARS
jgi:hypothetical protein